MFFRKLFILRGVLDGSHDFAKDLYDYMQEDFIPAYMLDINNHADFCSVINDLVNEEDIALHLDIHGNSDCMQFVDETIESWVDVVNLLNIIRNNIRVLTMNACKGAYLLDSQTKEGIPFLDYVIASKQDINVSEGCSRCHLFYNELYKSGNVLIAWQKFNDKGIINNSHFHIYKDGIQQP